MDGIETIADSISAELRQRLPHQRKTGAVVGTHEESRSGGSDGEPDQESDDHWGAEP